MTKTLLAIAACGLYINLAYADPNETEARTIRRTGDGVTVTSPDSTVPEVRAAENSSNIGENYYSVTMPQSQVSRNIKVLGYYWDSERQMQIPITVANLVRASGDYAVVADNDGLYIQADAPLLLLEKVKTANNLKTNQFILVRKIPYIPSVTELSRLRDLAVIPGTDNILLEGPSPAAPNVPAHQLPPAPVDPNAPAYHQLPPPPAPIPAPGRRGRPLPRPPAHQLPPPPQLPPPALNNQAGGGALPPPPPQLPPPALNNQAGGGGFPPPPPQLPPPALNNQAGGGGFPPPPPQLPPPALNNQAGGGALPPPPIDINALPQPIWVQPAPNNQAGGDEIPPPPALPNNAVGIVPAPNVPPNLVPALGDIQRQLNNLNQIRNNANVAPHPMQGPPVRQDDGIGPAGPIKQELLEAVQRKEERLKGQPWVDPAKVIEIEKVPAPGEQKIDETHKVIYRGFDLIMQKLHDNDDADSDDDSFSDDDFSDDGYDPNKYVPPPNLDDPMQRNVFHPQFQPQAPAELQPQPQPQDELKEAGPNVPADEVPPAPAIVGIIPAADPNLPAGGLPEPIGLLPPAADPNVPAGEILPVPELPPPGLPNLGPAAGGAPPARVERPVLPFNAELLQQQINNLNQIRNNANVAPHPMQQAPRLDEQDPIRSVIQNRRGNLGEDDDSGFEDDDDDWAD